MSIIVLKADSIKKNGLDNLTKDDVITDSLSSYKEEDIVIIQLAPKLGIAYYIQSENLFNFVTGDQDAEQIPVPSSYRCDTCYSYNYPSLLATYAKVSIQKPSVVKMFFVESVNCNNFLINIISDDKTGDILDTFEINYIGEHFEFFLYTGEYIIELVNLEYNRSAELELRIDTPDYYTIGNVSDPETIPFNIQTVFYNGNDYDQCYTDTDCTTCVVGSTCSPMLIYPDIDYIFYNGNLVCDVDYDFSCLKDNIPIKKIGSTCEPINYDFKNSEIVIFNFGINYCQELNKFYVGSACKPVEIINPIGIDIEFHNGIDYCYCTCNVDEGCNECVVGSSCTPMLITFNTDIEFNNGIDYCYCECNSTIYDCTLCNVGSSCIPLLINFDNEIIFYNGKNYCN